MKVNAVLIPKNIFKEHAAEYKNKISRTLIYSALSIALGLIIGTLLFIIKGNSFSEEIYSYLIKFTTEFSQKGFFEIFGGLVVVNAVYFFLMFIFGATPFGGIPSFCLSIFKCSAIGYLTSYLYGSFGLRGIEYSFLIIFPGKIIMLFAVLLLTESSITSSLKIKESLSNESSKKINLNKYYLRNILIACIFFFSSLVDSITAICFSKLFTF